MVGLENRRAGLAWVPCRGIRSGERLDEQADRPGRHDASELNRHDR
jgi:hypothetical protein